ncbi:hypothetical protein M132T_06130 [Marinilactibacillus psychrotolerans]|uniref:Uncharacterized protein n=1 Tax=Marinilactibacillus psychrotolerans TaxID=191770 RepID=A0AAV3WQ70_9LACT|nr:hypothetical protein M132T_06130 [Marinilactibacillus psychrotolerans]SDC81755.1 hypothetical protein SAMN04488013_1103 [Marinilactibacillus psychrotolerans]
MIRMYAAIIIPLIYLAILLVILASGYISKRSVISIIKENDSLKPTQVKSGIMIVNTVYYTIVMIIVLTVLAPFIIQWISFN